MSTRAQSIETLSTQHFDAVIVGGGINGAVSACALASRGARVAIIDRTDFAGVTSQQSSNLAWGGIKYMESYEFPLVRALCMSRNELLRSYPSTVREIRFLTTVPKGFRHHPRMLWLGAWLYWFVGNLFTAPPRWLGHKKVQAEEPTINPEHGAGFVEYSDAYLFDNDARFVFNFVRTAVDRGAIAANYVESLGAVREDGRWTIDALDRRSSKRFGITADVLINAAGPHVDEHNALSQTHTDHQHVYSKGIHLLVDRITANQRVLAFFADDGRLFFVIPMGKRTCLGTTDTRMPSASCEVTPEDRDFVLDNINARLQLNRPLTRDDIIAERCGVRPLVTERNNELTQDFLQMSRKHAVDIDDGQKHISIFGGKLTDCINVGDEICSLAADMGVALRKDSNAWYGEPGADARAQFIELANRLGLAERMTPDDHERLIDRYWRRYGAEAQILLEKIAADPTLAEALVQGTGYTRAEIPLARDREMIVTLEDFLRRRTMMALMYRRDELREMEGLREACEILFPGEGDAQFEAYFDSNH
jgi:glycerol-3-phosphate dehydrogenase